MANENLSISIITPSFNQGGYLEQTIDSVLSQKYSNIEYIIIDGGSRDNSVEIIKKYEKHLSFWISEPDQGQSDAINKGLKLANGDILNWLNADDYYEPNALQLVAAQFADKRINVMCGRGNVVSSQREFVKCSRGTDVYQKNLGKTIGWARIDQPETFFRRSVLEKTGPINPSLHYVMDKAWWINYLLIFGLKGIRKIDDVLVNFRLHQASKTVSQHLSFACETDALFYHLALQYGFLSETEGIRHFAGIDTTSYSDDLVFPVTDSSLVKQSLHYYLLKRADEFYYQHQREKAKTCLSIIDPMLLYPPDQSLFSRLKKRCQWVPVPVVKLLRK